MAAEGPRVMAMPSIALPGPGSRGNRNLELAPGAKLCHALRRARTDILYFKFTSGMRGRRRDGLIAFVRAVWPQMNTDFHGYRIKESENFGFLRSVFHPCQSVAVKST